MLTVGDQNFVAAMIIRPHRTRVGNPILLVAEEILDAQQNALRLLVDGRDPPRFPFADDVRQVAGQKRGLMLHSREPEIARDAPRPRRGLPNLIHQPVRGKAIRGAGAETRAAIPGEEAALPVDHRRFQREVEVQNVRLRRLFGGELPFGPGVRQSGSVARPGTDAQGISGRGKQISLRIDVNRQDVSRLGVAARQESDAISLRRLPVSSQNLECWPSLGLQFHGYRFGKYGIVRISLAGPQFQVKAGQQRNVFLPAAGPRTRIGIEWL